ncbi:hypothetical protein Cgig2_034177 [Carnegiea gigantea]|uniref:Reverse transcriptase zinc-binding domain-containing protein n=1 Tax=Carnegiea gigantea TaxID=171969 RepID=A0A9Q1JGK8_9CARY|nr:hypothetical protein Cgig2_034177 [Carnegiea gigantea]
MFLDQIRPHLLSLNRSSFKNLREQQETSSPSQRYGSTKQGKGNESQIQHYFNLHSNVNKNGSSMEIHALDFSLQKQNRGNWLPISTPSKMLWVHGLRDLTIWVRLSTKQRLAKFYPQEDLHCPLCQRETEDDHHLFYGCQYASAMWIEIQSWWAVSPASDSIEGRL